MAASDILRNPVKDKLARGEVVASMTVRLSRSTEIARIAKTAGFDMLYIDLGLNDMLGDMGLAGQYDHPRVKDIYQTVIGACRRHGKHCGGGGLASRPDLMAEYVRMGAHYVSTGTDLSFLLSAATARAKQIKDIEL